MDLIRKIKAVALIALLATSLGTFAAVANLALLVSKQTHEEPKQLTCTYKNFS